MRENKAFDCFDSISTSILKILESCPDSEIVVAGDFNVHNTSWLSHSSGTTSVSTYAKLFGAHNHLAQLVNEPTHIPCDGQFQNTLDLFLTSHPEKYEFRSLAPLGNSDHITLSASFSYSRLQSVSHVATKRSVFIYEKARWAQLNDFYRQFNWKLCFFDDDVDAAAKMVERVILLGMKLFIPSKSISAKPRHKCWFNQTCKAAVRSREEAFSNWRMNSNGITDRLRKQARTECAKVLRREKFVYEQRLRAKVLAAPRGIDPSENDHDAENSDRSDDEENDEIADDGMVEKTFKFDDFAKRLLNPKIVRACVVVLTDWEQIPTKSLKAAVTILHRIAYGCSCPAMLYQAKLFRVFQQVFHAVRDAHHEELRRLGIYVVRKFVETAPNNPKIYAELLFYKSIREANELESGYCDAYESGTKGTWTEEQEAELRFLFEENQRNPETDKDVIDWILENLIDKTRTRRGVLKKLKDMGLQFKAPTKKSTARAQNKNLWPTEEDEELRSLYDQYRIEDDCLQRILDEFGDRRNKQQIIKRMLQLHIIADKSEILPEKPKKRKSKKKGGDNDDENDDEDEYMEEPTFGEQPSTSGGNKPKKTAKAKQRKIVRTPLDVGTIRALIAQIDAEKYQEAIDWLKECLDDAADDTDEPSEEDDGVPLVPLQEVQKDAMEDDNFKKVLVALGIQPPVFGMESYWRIPTYLNSADLKLRAKIMGGEEVEIDVEDLEEDEGDDNSDNDNEAVGENAAYQDGEESEEDYLETLGMAKERNKLDNLENYMDQQREKLKSLMFSKSDEETEKRAPLKANKKPKAKKERKSKNEKNDSDSEEDPDLVNKIKKKLDKKKRNMDLSSEEEEENVEEPGTFKKPKEKEVAKPNTGDLFDQLKAKRASSKMNVIDMVAEPKSSSKVEKAGKADDDNDFDFNSEDYRKRLAELGDDEDDVESADEAEKDIPDKQKTLTNRSRRANVIESDSDDDDVVDNVNKDGNNPDDDDDGVKTIRQQETGDSNDASDTLMKKRRRSDTEKSPEDEEVEEEKDSDEDAKFLTRKKPSPSKQTFAETGEEPAKRRRIAIIDDDDEDD